MSFSAKTRLESDKGVINTYRFHTDGGVVSMPAPRYTPGVVWTLDHAGLIFAGYNETYDIQILSEKGELIKRIHRDVKPAKIPEEEKKEIREDLRIRHGAVVHLIKIPQVKPAFIRFNVVEDYLFVLKERFGKDYFYDVFGRAGDYLGDIELDFQPLICKNGFVYTIRFMFEGEARRENIMETEIVRYRIAEGSRGASIMAKTQPSEGE